MFTSEDFNNDVAVSGKRFLWVIREQAVRECQLTGAL
jgi:hypothetical protein